MAVAALGFSLAGCFGGALDELDSAEPTGSAFSQALFQDYSYLARSFGELEDVEDPNGWIPFVDTMENPLKPIQDAFANKALLASAGQEPGPEAGVDAASQSARTRLVALLDQTRDRFPTDAAQAQAQFDCWMLNSYVDSQAAAAQACRRAFDNAMLKLNNDLRPVVSAPIAPVASAPAAPVSDYTVYFNFDSWTLSAEALSVITDAVNTARTGGQSRITIVGHADTSGSADYNQKLSERRANVVEEAMVQMGARREAISVSGVGESDLLVPTGDGVQEPRNRRAVVNLLP
jgi:OOP family OmpA-OmpF porin